MAVVGKWPERGLRVALELASLDDRHAHYRGDAFTPSARHAIALDVDRSTGAAALEVGDVEPRAPVAGDDTRVPLAAAELAFLRQLGMQIWRHATQTPPENGGGVWSRRVQRWRAPR